MLSAIAFSIVAGCGQKYPPLDTVPHVDMKRYIGLWYEIARYPAWFEKDCVGVTAEYSFNPDGTIKVVNSCRVGTLDGRKKKAKGRARVVDPSNAKLKVSFFLFFEGDYWILELGGDYDYAVVGVPSRKYLWVLSREPQMDDTLYQEILSRLPARGYDPSKLIRTSQSH
jgi:apolipoprotein D and lipocalin family protein